MKIANMLGRGIEGCGVTKFAVELKQQLDVDIFATKDMKWSRNKSHNVDANLFLCEDMEEVNKVAETINNTYDLVLVSSVPSKTHKEVVQDNFVELIKKIKVRKALIQHDHKIHSIIRNARLDDVCNNVDILFAPSLEGDFVRWCKENNIQKKICKFEEPFVFDTHRKQYWRDINEQQPNMARWIGRTAMWKGPDLMIDFHDAVLKENNFITVLEGLEASIQYKLILYKKDGTRRNVVNYFRPEKEYNEFTKFSKNLHGAEIVNTGAYLYPGYEHGECMERLSRSGFGAELCNFAKKYGQNLEFAHCEVIASGCVPIFHKQLGDWGIHPKFGDPCIKCKDHGTLFLDYNNFDEIKEKMILLRDDPVMRNEWREMSYEFWSSYLSFDNIMNKIITSAMEQ